ncbi:MAG: hypothetical protein K2Q15_02395 [Burkholderiales bacterium]|nr:hypothetical protein [Burkholderiales bacterium]
MKNNSKQIQYSLLCSICVAFIFLFFYYFTIAIFPASPLIMRGELNHVFIWSLSGVALSFLRSSLLKVVFIIIMGFYVVGNLNAVASYYHYGLHYLTDLILTNFIYSIFTLVFILGLVFFERVMKIDKMVVQENLIIEPWNTLFMATLFVFPFIWLFDQLIAVGGIPPILSGKSIVNEMYTTEYGRLYGYGVILSISALLMWQKKTESSNLMKSTIWIGILITLFAMIFDGRRVFLLIFIGSLISFEVVRFGEKNMIKPLVKYGAILIVAYIGLLFARQGGWIFNSAESATIFSAVGVEYRDFAFVVTHFLPGSVPGYSFLGSILGGFGNSLFLSILGLSKNALVFSGSAYQLAILYKSNFGIRVGLFAEIWLEWGWFGLAPLFICSFIFASAVRLVLNTTTQVGRAFSCVIFSVLLLTFVGQASAAAGYFSLLLYLWFVWKFLNLSAFVGKPNDKK